MVSENMYISNLVNCQASRLYHIASIVVRINVFLRIFPWISDAIFLKMKIINLLCNKILNITVN